MSDIEELSTMFQSTNFVQESQYKKVEWVQVADQQGNNYANGFVSFNLESNKTQYSILADSYLVVPIKVTKDAGHGARLLAVKSSILSLIQGVQVTTSGGAVIVNEITGCTPIVANLKLMLDSSIDFVESNELMYCGHDKYVQPDPSGRNLALLAGASHDVTSGTPENDPLRNPALQGRITVFKARAVSSGAGVVQELLAYLPLKFIHSFFEQMNFPITQFPLNLTFNFAGTSSFSQYNPWQCPVVASHQTLGDAAAGYAIGLADLTPSTAVGDTTAAADRQAAIKTQIDRVITHVNTIAGTVAASSMSAGLAAATIVSTEIMNASTTDHGFSTAPKLYMKVVHLHEKEGLAYVAAVKSGFKHQITYTVSDIFRINQDAGAGPAVPIDRLISSSVVRPTRIWALPVAKNTLTSTNNSFPSTIGPVKLTKANILINGVPFYQNQLRHQYEFYRILRTQMTAGNGHAAISFTDFLNGQSLYCFDLSRSETCKSNTQCEISLSCELIHPGDVPDTDFLVITERLETMVMNVNENGTAISVNRGVSSE